MKRVNEILIEEIGKRCSRRKYSDKMISVEEEAEILRIIEEINDDGDLEFEANINYGGEAFDGFNSYGLIRGCNSYIALIGDSRDKHIKEKIGYYGEYLVLKLTQMGLGTCWVGGTYDKKSIEKEIETKYSDEIYCVIALGHIFGTEKTNFEKVIGFFGKNNKSQKDIFKTENPLNENKEWIEKGLECVYKAPSALNRKPWRFWYNGKNICLKSNKESEFDKIDIGIAMLHFQMGAEKAGFRGKWKFINNCWEFIEE